VHIFLTGGTGFFGRALLRHWCSIRADDLTVTVLSRDPERFRSHNAALVEGADWLRFHTGDVTRAESLPLGGGFTHVVHAATDVYDGPEGDALEMYANNVIGTRNVAEMAVRVGAQRLLFTSSGAVYSRPGADIYAVAEDDPGALDPLARGSAYGLSKIAGEHICALSAERWGLDFVVARGFTFSGQDLPLNSNFAIGNFVRDALGGGPVVVNGDGTAMRSYLDQRDLACWLLAILTRGAQRQAYNVGSDEAITMGELAATVARVSSGATDVTIMGKGDPNDRPSRYVPAIDRARDELGLEVTIKLEDSIRDMLENAV
jgi:dTDP-glucose 4,6-dehydratase